MQRENVIQGGNTGVIHHVFIIGSKGFGSYGGYETFVDKLTEYHQANKNLKYHVACKANGEGSADVTKLCGVRIVSNKEFFYHNARCFKIHVPNIGAAQAVYYDVKALSDCCNYIKNNKIEHFCVYILACRVGPFTAFFQKKINKLGGKLYLNPDGHEWMRAKWSIPVRWYWKLSERMMVKHCDLAICDSKNIEKYMHESYGAYKPVTTYIAYGAETRKSRLCDHAPELERWFLDKGLQSKTYYLVVGRFVPENNYEIMIREFMKSKSKKDFVIVTTKNDIFLNELESRLHFKKDKRIKIVGTVYDQELLMKIRENSYGYLHGHEVGGTNPSLLEALSSTDLNLLLDVGFNREVAEDAAVYWSKEKGNLAKLIDWADLLSEEMLGEYGAKAKKRIETAYSWKLISEQYADVFLK